MIYVCMQIYVCTYMYMYVYMCMWYMYMYQKPFEDVRVKQHQYHIVWNYWQIYFEIYGFFISVVCKIKWKAYVQIIIITNKIQIYEMLV